MSALRVFFVFVMLFPCFPVAVNATWPESGVPITQKYGLEVQVEIVPDDDGGAIMTWIENDNDVYAQKIDASGNAAWLEGGKPLGIPVNDYCGNKSTIPDGYGGFVVMIRDWNDGYDNLLLYAFDENGDVKWGQSINATINDMAISTGQNAIYFVSSVYDWNNGIDTLNVYKIDAYGNVEWHEQFESTEIWDEWNEVDAVSDGAGGVIVCWSSNDLILALRLDQDGNSLWNDTAGVEIPSGREHFLSLISDGSGGAIMAFDLESEFGIWDFLAAQRIDAYGSLPWDSFAVILSGNCPESSDRFDMAVSDTSGVIFTWVDDNTLFTQKIERETGDYHWGPYDVILASGLCENILPKIAADDAGGAIIVWHDDNATGDPIAELDIFAQRVDQNGSILWSESGEPIIIQARDQILPEIIPDGSGGAFICWQDGRNIIPDIYSLRINSAGSRSLAGEIIPSISRLNATNYPNPFNPSTTITYSVASRSEVVIDIFNAAGRHVANLCKEDKDQGLYKTIWDGKDRFGSEVSSGVYFYRITAGDQTISKKMVLIR